MVSRYGVIEFGMRCVSSHKCRRRHINTDEQFTLSFNDHARAAYGKRHPHNFRFLFGGGALCCVVLCVVCALQIKLHTAHDDDDVV